MFRLENGKVKTMYFRKADTTARSSLRDGSLVVLNDSGKLSYASNDSTDRVVGVCRQRVAAADTAVSDSWPNAPWVPVQVPVEKFVEWRIDTDSDGGAVDSDVGRYCGVDTAEAGDSEATNVDINDTVFPQVYITRVISGTQIIGVLSRLADVRSFDSLDTTR